MTVKPHKLIVKSKAVSGKQSIKQHATVRVLVNNPFKETEAMILIDTYGGLNNVGPLQKPLMIIKVGETEWMGTVDDLKTLISKPKKK
jgi:hypothetical protein